MSSVGTVSTPTGDNANNGQPLVFAALTMAFLIFLIVLRFGIIMLLDACVLDDMDVTRRKISELCRKFCPWWNRRTNPEVSSSSDVEMPPSCTMIDASDDGCAIWDKLLPSTIVSRDDLQRWKEQHETLTSAVTNSGEVAVASTSTSRTGVASTAASAHICDDCSHGNSTAHEGMTCSICLLELNEGDCMFTAKCLHAFHRDCIREWLSHSGDDCPNCRSEIVPPALLLKARQNSNPATLVNR